MVQPERLKQAQAVIEETRKMALERTVLPQIKSLFSQMTKDYVAELTRTGSVPSASDFQREWESVFLRHYRRVGRVFLPNQRRSNLYEALINTKQTLSPEGNQQLLSSYGRWSREFGAQQSQFVTETNQKDYMSALQQATEQTEDASALVIATAAGVILRRLFRGRETTIANVQTQAPAEEAKRQEAVAITVEQGGQEDEVEKRWQTVGDANVRVAHIAANGQQRPGNSAFSVGGEDLRYPGDSTLGASVGNTINCRCAALYL